MRRAHPKKQSPSPSSRLSQQPKRKIITSREGAVSTSSKTQPKNIPLTSVVEAVTIKKTIPPQVMAQAAAMEDSEAEEEQVDSDAEASSSSSVVDTDVTSCDESSDEDEAGFESQGSSSEEEDDEQVASEDEEDVEDQDDEIHASDLVTPAPYVTREAELSQMEADGSLEAAKHLHVDDLSSDDEGEIHPSVTQVNTIGRNIPLKWYEAYDHIGYDASGQKIVKNTGAMGDKIDQALAFAEDGSAAHHTVYDAYNDTHVVLNPREMELIRRISSGAFAHPECDATPDYVDYFSSVPQLHPLSNPIEPKSRFVPSKWERMKVLKIMQGIKDGRIVPAKTPSEEDEEASSLSLSDLWSTESSLTSSLSHRRGPQHVSAPKCHLPGHAESYHPPSEYLYTPEEEAAWHAMDPSDRDLDFLPQSFPSLRAVTAFPAFVRERFERCLDLYLCPRLLKKKLNIDPESLVPVLPKPSELRPFPNALAFHFAGHALNARIRAVSIDNVGQYVVSGAEDGTLKLWEIDTGRCVTTYHLGAPVTQVAFNPSSDYTTVLAASAGANVFLIHTGLQVVNEYSTATEKAEDAVTEALLGAECATRTYACSASASTTTTTTPFLSEGEGDAPTSVTPMEMVKEGAPTDASAAKQTVTWQHYRPTSDVTRGGIRAVIQLTTEVGTISTLAWHAKGDYLATVLPTAIGKTKVMIYQLSKRASQSPFGKATSQVVTVAFHPTKPIFFYAARQHVRIYHLVKQHLMKKLVPGVKWISSLCVHPSGDHVIIGSYDRRVCWFDLDLSSSPFKTLKYHTKAIRAVACHSSYPLMATASDDGTIHIFHAKVFTDLSKNPLLVPLKILTGLDSQRFNNSNTASISNGLGVLALAFHPTQPWIVTAGADGTLSLFQSLHK